MTAQITIRSVLPGEAAIVAELARRTFRETFSADNTPADMAEYVERSFGDAVVAEELADPSNTFLLASAGTDTPPIGYAKLRAGIPNRSVRGPKPVEIERIYVAREALGTGIGARLMRACLDEAARAGYETIWLGVWEENPRAIAFYERWEFETVGEHLFLLGSDEQNDLIMARPVRESPKAP